METEYVILLDFSTGEIIKIKLSERQRKESEQYDDFEEYLATLEKETLEINRWKIGRGTRLNSSHRHTSRMPSSA